MPQPTIAVIPLDDRAVNYECLALLGQAAGCQMLLPPKAWLGTPWRTGQMDRLGAWLHDVAPTADALIVALDTLGYGGLVDSRRSTASLAAQAWAASAGVSGALASPTKRMATPTATIAPNIRCSTVRPVAAFDCSPDPWVIGRWAACSIMLIMPTNSSLNR